MLLLSNILQQSRQSICREMEAKENVAEEVLFEAFMSVYWITKQEIPIRKLVPLLQLVQKVAVPRLKCISS